MDAPEASSLPVAVQPGETLDLRLQMVAPLASYTYSGFWMLRDETGQLFGSGSSGDEPLEVTIIVPVMASTHNL